MQIFHTQGEIYCIYSSFTQIKLLSTKSRRVYRLWCQSNLFFFFLLSLINSQTIGNTTRPHSPDMKCTKQTHTQTLMHIKLYYYSFIMSCFKFDLSLRERCAIYVNFGMYWCRCCETKSSWFKWFNENPLICRQFTTKWYIQSQLNHKLNNYLICYLRICYSRSFSYLCVCARVCVFTVYVNRSAQKLFICEVICLRIL